MENPASHNILSSPSSRICLSTAHEPGTSHAVMFSAFFLPLTTDAKALKSSIRPFVQAPKKHNLLYAL